MYDIVGDLHGHGGCLARLFDRLGYRRVGGVWEAPGGRRTLFLGDLINRGPDQLAVLTDVRAMVEAGTAQVVLGNHEYFAIGWVTPHPDRPGDFGRPHTPPNRRQHQAFLDAVGEGSAEHRRWIDWLSGFPLWLELDGIRLVHACWSPDAFATLAPILDGDNRLGPGGYRATLTDPVLGDAIGTVVKGPELTLPAAFAFTDANGNRRDSIRRRWWHPAPQTYADLALPQPTWSMPPEPLPADILTDHRPYPADRPLFFGHYARHGRSIPAEDLRRGNFACLDFGVVNEGGALAAYRWDGEDRIDPDHIVSVPRAAAV